ncbi:MAG: sulfotransferase domain-containing protein [Salaquimonas sp.]
MIIHQRDATWWFKMNGAARLAIVKGALNGFTKPVVLTEYPKSGGTWLSQMISAALEIPYPRNRLPHLSSQIIHGCYLNVNKNIDTVVVWRDGRDTMVSFYYHLMFEKPITSSRFSKRLRGLLSASDPHDIQKLLPAFIEWTFNGGYPRYSWATFVDKWKLNSPRITTSYESINENPSEELKRVLTLLGRSDISTSSIDTIVHEFSFEKQSSRKPGDEDVKSFVRKGIVGDWKNVFNDECRELFNHYAGEQLISLGYEKNSDWVNNK